MKQTKPVMGYYGSYKEMLQMMMIRQKGNKSKKQENKERFAETFKANTADFSFVETGQEIFDDDIDERMLDLTPNS